MKLRIKEFWSKMPILYKVYALFVVFLVPLLTLIGIVIAEFTMYRGQTDRMLAEYALCTNYAAALREERAVFDQLASHAPDPGVLEQYNKKRAQTEQYWQMLCDSSSEDASHAMTSIEQAIMRERTHFQQSAGAMAEAMLHGQFDSAQYAALAEQMDYLKIDSDELTMTMLEEGRTIYWELGREMAARNILLVAAVICSMIGLVISVTLLIHGLVSPIRRLSYAALEVADGSYDGPSFAYPHADEIGSLGEAFESMKQRIARTISALEGEAKLQKRLRLQQMETARLNQLVANGRFALLQSQINPHFLFNTLQSVSNMAELEGAAVTHDMIMRLASFFRYTLETDDTIVTLNRELALLRDYISLMELRFAERISFEMECDVRCGEFDVPKFILQPLVENAVGHGLRNRASGGRVRVRTRGDMHRCIIWVTDNGCGFGPASQWERQKTHQSIGLQNIVDRVVLRGGDVKIFSRPGWGTCIRITLSDGKNGEGEDRL